MCQVCIGCGNAYRYRLSPPKAGQGQAKPDVKLRPCPTCGLYQPDMIGSRRMRFHLGFGLLGAIAAGVVAGLGVSDAEPERVMMWIAAGIAAATFLCQLAVTLWNPNRNPSANRSRAKRWLESGSLEGERVPPTNRGDAGLPRWGFGLPQGLALAGIAFGIVLFVSAELIRLAFGWPLNEGWYPGVVGPGDESRLYFAERISPVKGLWNGQAGAELLNTPEVGLADARLDTTTQQDTWQGNIWMSNKNDKTRLLYPWVAIRIPDSPQLAGAQLRIKANLTAEFPALRGGHYENEQRSFTQTASVQLATTPGAGRLYATVWHVSAFGGAVWLLLMSLILVVDNWSLSRHANPRKVVTEEDDQDEDERPRRRRRRDDPRDEDDEPPRRRRRGHRGTDGGFP
jgi:hypothetical protein